MSPRKSILTKEDVGEKSKPRGIVVHPIQVIFDLKPIS